MQHIFRTARQGKQGKKKIRLTEYFTFKFKKLLPNSRFIVNIQFFFFLPFLAQYSYSFDGEIAMTFLRKKHFGENM